MVILSSALLTGKLSLALFGKVVVKVNIPEVYFYAYF